MVDVAEQALSSAQNGGPIGATHYWVRYRPQTRLLVIGSDPTALAIAQLAKEAEFEVIFVRPLGPTLSPPTAPDVYRTTKPGLRRIPPRSSHGRRVPNHDFEANGEDIAHALRSGAGYVGMVGAARSPACQRQMVEAAWIERGRHRKVQIAHRSADRKIEPFRDCHFCHCRNSVRHEPALRRVDGISFSIGGRSWERSQYLHIDRVALCRQINTCAGRPAAQATIGIRRRNARSQVCSRCMLQCGFKGVRRYRPPPLRYRSGAWRARHSVSVQSAFSIWHREFDYCRLDRRVRGWI